MKLSISSSALVIAYASLALARPVYKSASEPTQSVYTRSKVQFARDLDSLIIGLPVLGKALTPLTPLMDSVGLNDPSKLAKGTPLNDQQKEVLAKVEAGLAKVVETVESTLPKNLPIPIPIGGKRNSMFEARSLDSVITELPMVGNVLGPVASLLDAVGLNDPSKFADDAPLTAEQKATISQLKAALMTAVEDVRANLPNSNGDLAKTITDPLHLGATAKRGYTRRGPEGTLDTLLNGLPVVGSLLSPVTSMFDSLGLGDSAALVSKTPLSGVQKDTLAKLKEAVAAAATKVAGNLPVPIPLDLLPLKG